MIKFIKSRIRMDGSSMFIEFLQKHPEFPNGRLIFSLSLSKKDYLPIIRAKKYNKKVSVTNTEISKILFLYTPMINEIYETHQKNKRKNKKKGLL